MPLFVASPPPRRPHPCNAAPRFSRPPLHSPLAALLLHGNVPADARALFFPPSLHRQLHDARFFLPCTAPLYVQGVYVLMSGLDYERLVLAAGPLGLMQAGGRCTVRLRFGSVGLAWSAARPPAPAPHPTHPRTHPPTPTPTNPHQHPPPTQPHPSGAHP